MYDDAPDVSPDAEKADYIFIGGGDLLLSCSATSILQELRLGDEIGFLPTRVLNRAGDKVGDYYMVYAREERDCLDVAGSEVEYYQEGKVIAEVFKWALDPEKIPPLDLFRCQERWVATETLKHQFETNRLRGIKFVPIWSHEEGSAGRVNK
jgi:hypothetical protein